MFGHMTHPVTVYSVRRGSTGSPTTSQPPSLSLWARVKFLTGLKLSRPGSQLTVTERAMMRDFSTFRL